MRLPPWLTVKPPCVAGKKRLVAKGTAAIRLWTVSATYRVPSGSSATPVGPRTRALEFSSSGNPVATVVVPRSTGGRPAGSKMLRRSTVPWFTWLPAAATVPLSTFVTNSCANGPNSCTEVKSHGPLMPWPAHVSTGTPALLRTMRHPASGVPVPCSVTGRLPTTT